ncbi:Replication factor-A carboxy-terminal domain protein [Arachis hypogaea]|uniref:Replication factor-A carboxy-terminal domain protein n=1 Tax=Arachis hypogaea TaxID=3818 RepID=A0A6B9VAB9_ARAHY|nr:Replication factor-A carboxy-terminal domain protein [Arachis hypogaea]
MSLTIDPLQKISPWKETWSIEAKILTIWEDASIVNENMQKLLHVVLMDKQHDKVQATVDDDLITTFIHQLKEGHVFIISDFKVIPNGGLVRVTRHRFRILFKCSTSVVAAANRDIPNPGLSLTSMDEILQKRTDYEYLIDFVGVLCGLKRKADVECNGKILNKKIPCNLVGDCSALMDINSLKRYQRPPVLILQSFKIKVNGDKVSLQNVINVSRVSINPDIYHIASHHFSRLHSNEIGDLDGQFFVVGKIKEIVEDPEWWLFSCVCGHPIVGDDNVFHCQLCGREVQHFMTSYRIKILVEDGTSCGMFVLLDSAVTKLLGRTCSDVFLLLEDEMEKIEHPYCPQFFHQLIGKEIVFKVQAKRINSPGYCGTFKIINVISDAHFFNKLQSDQCIKDVSSDSAFSPILEDFSQCGQLRSYDNQVISGVPIQLHSIKEMLADILCAKIYSSASRNDQICFLISKIIDVLKHQKWWCYYCLCNAPVSHVGNLFYCYLCRFECVDAIRRYRIKIIVSHSNGSNIFILEDDEVMQILKKMDPRPIGYELNTSLHVVRAICDDIDIVRFLEDSIHDNQQQKFHLDPFVPHFPFEFKNPVEFHSNASIQCSSSSSAPVRQASPISVLNWNSTPPKLPLLSAAATYTEFPMFPKKKNEMKPKEEWGEESMEKEGEGEKREAARWVPLPPSSPLLAEGKGDLGEHEERERAHETGRGRIWSRRHHAVAEPCHRRHRRPVPEDLSRASVTEPEELILAESPPQLLGLSPPSCLCRRARRERESATGESMAAWVTVSKSILPVATVVQGRPPLLLCPPTALLHESEELVPVEPPPPLLGFAASVPLGGKPSSHTEQERQRELRPSWRSNHRNQPLFTSPASPPSEPPPSVPALPLTWLIMGEKGGGAASAVGEPCCHRRRTLPLIHRSFWPPLELLSGPVRNRNCFVLLFRCRQFGLRRKGLDAAFGLWNCVLR